MCLRDIVKLAVDLAARAAATASDIWKPGGYQLVSTIL